jgi:uncharacterized alpha/beta hydrolase family protein
MHLIIFVHGLNGNSIDFKHMRSQLSEKLQHSEKYIFLCSKINECKSELSIEKQGKYLA